MLRRVNSLLNADVLYALCSMGHGDKVVVADANFPGDSIARQTTLGRLIRIDNVEMSRAVRAILTVLPVEEAARMEVMGAPDEIPPIQEQVQEQLDRAEPEIGEMRGVERFAFYEEAKKAYCVIQTTDRRFYGCFILTKGVIPLNT